MMMQQQAALPSSQEDYETITSRCVERFLRYLFRGFKDKKVSVRLRCCQILALSISGVGELEYMHI